MCASCSGTRRCLALPAPVEVATTGSARAAHRRGEVSADELQSFRDSVRARMTALQMDEAE